MPEADLTVGHLKQLLENIPDDWALHFEDLNENVFVIDKTTLDNDWEMVDFHLNPVTREEQEEIAEEMFGPRWEMMLRD